MSFRNLKKLEKLQDSSSSCLIDEDLDNEIVLDHDDNDLNQSSSNNYNRFSILDTNVEIDQDAASEGDNKNVEYNNGNNMHFKKSIIKKKKNKSKNINKELSEIDDNCTFLVFHEIENINKISDNHNSLSKSITENHENKLQQKQLNLLSINLHFLDSNMEMKTLFGKKAIDNDSKKKSRKHRASFETSKFSKSPLMRFKESWSPLLNSGISMDVVNYIDGIGYFKFTFSRTYQDIQQQFLSAVHTFDPNNLLILLQYNPYHVDTLLQVSEILKQEGNHQDSIDLIERALYSLGRGFHPAFNISTGRVRLPFNYSENRSMYLALYRHIHNLEKKGCWRTAFEFNKLLLSLSPLEDKDCYGALLTIDFFALMSKEYDYIIELSEWHDQEYLKRLPSFAFSLALALFHKENIDDLHINSKEKIAIAACTFPWVIKSLFLLLELDIPNGYGSIDPPTDLDALYMDIYLSRAKDIWNTPKHLSFLRSVFLKPPLVDENIKDLDYSIPAGVLRYVLLSGNRNFIQYLPPSITSQPIMEYDIFPPDNFVPFIDSSTFDSENSLTT
ncbi:hypothetical protein T552_02056 [Pneumocystis carinii B80]|uniref:Transcription factor 25 n=1 Tax=Pneumocystis carinii (strain B80) TaxID=1408658 RepID=A0A0W4ZGX0_PNEC8|nr:hypothetical protein T552_02056 [Pneumocystis carinii B80]KTW27614.1 hypothetical protein T552_02056 [Pneumocystis carinii B80]